MTTHKKPLSIFSLVMINVIAIDSLRTLPMSAEYGLSLVFYYAVAALLFFIPVALVSAELATGWPETGGIYVWAREAFGKQFGFLTIWLQWFYNICWYPTIMSFVAATLAYCINPHLVDSKAYMLTVIFLVFWGSTLVNFFGMHISSFFSTISAIAGTLLPMLFITALGVIWIFQGKPVYLHYTWHDFFPDLSSVNNMAFLTAVLYGLVGIEMSATHAGEVENPQHNYPKAIFWSVLIILATLIFSSLAIAAVIPQEKINIVSGLLQAFEIFFAAFHMSWFMPILAFLIILSAIGGTNAWILGPSKSLLIACHDGSIPSQLGFQNRHGTPVVILILQGVIFTILCSVFFLMPTFSSGFWVLTDVTAILSLLVYVAMFAAALKLRYQYPEVKRSFVVPGGKIGLWITCLIGSISCFFTIGLGFLRPSQLPVGSLVTYELIIGGGVLLSCLFPFASYAFHKRLSAGNR